MAHFGPIFLDFWSFFCRSKKHTFSDRAKIDPGPRHNRPFRAPGSIWDQILLIWEPFFHRFSDFFQNLQKHFWSLQLHTFNGFSPSKTSHFPTQFSLIFLFFQNRSWGLFLAGPGADLSSTGRFWCHFRFSGFPKRHLLGAIFAQKVDLELPGGRAETVLGATLRRTTLQN